MASDPMYIGLVNYTRFEILAILDILHCDEAKTLILVLVPA